ncbi:MAG TPA: amidohydrolase family protein [Caldilineaceae bacterium]|nr:amidohydrolase family protein [Caldilineaceae bacterium]
MDLTPHNAEWLAQVTEPIIDPERPIIDPHHHLWHANRWTHGAPYLLDDLWADTQSGHNVQKTVFVQCSSSYRTDGSEHLKPIGETEFVAAIAEASAAQNEGKAVIAGIVSHADLTLPTALLDAVLDAHEAAGRGRFRGIRHAGAHHPNPAEAYGPGLNPPGLFLREDFQAGVRQLGQRDYTYESWHYHMQLKEFTALARATSETTIILDHFGTPLGVGSYATARETIFTEWQQDIAELAQCPNVYAKLGGLAMPDNGFGWHEASCPATSDELVAAQKRYFDHMIDSFGAERCMFESNFPVDKLSIAYPVLWNAFKKIAADYSASEKDALF